MTGPGLHPRDVTRFLRGAYKLSGRDADLLSRQVRRSAVAAAQFLPAPWVEALHPDREKGRPGANGTAWKAHALDASKLPDPADLIEGVFVLVVAFRADGELRFRRRVYLQLQSAQRAHARAVMRGQAASLTLCRLAPVSGLDGGAA